MPETQLVVKAFVASPADVTDERQILEETIRELNTAWSRNLKLRLELIRWETDVTPGIGAYPQDVINQQVADDYDIFIGILWTRIGSRTPVAQSGTLEEFERALARYRREATSIEIMFYFKTAPISPSEIDIEQFAKLTQFKKDLGEEGALYRNFTSRDEFAHLMRLHLSRVVQRWQRGPASEALGVEQRQPSAPTETKDSDEEPGLLDHIEEGIELFERGIACLENITSATNDVGAAMSARTEDINNLSSNGEPTDFTAAKRIAKRTAEDLDAFSARVGAEIPLFSDYFNSAFTHVVAAASVHIEDFDCDLAQLRNVREMFENNYKVLLQAIYNVLEFRSTLARLPRLHSTFNKARRRAISVNDTLIGKLESIKRTSQESAILVAELIDKASITGTEPIATHQ
jgi:hypothetical protein